MTIDEAIKDMETIAEENQRVVDTGIVFDDVTIDMLYADDTEVIEEHLANYRECAEKHRQLAEWLKDYKRLLEQEHCDDCISRDAAIRIAEQGQIQGYEWQFKKLVTLPPVKPKVGKCKYCKWQKDSDGVFRRGIGAESKCSINSIEVYEGTGYCYMFEPKTQEVEE